MSLSFPRPVLAATLLALVTASLAAPTAAQAVCPNPRVHPYLSSAAATYVQNGKQCTAGHAVRAVKAFYTSGNNAYTAHAFGDWKSNSVQFSIATLPYGFHKSHGIGRNY